MSTGLVYKTTVELEGSPHEHFVIVFSETELRTPVTIRCLHCKEQWEEDADSPVDVMCRHCGECPHGN